MVCRYDNITSGLPDAIYFKSLPAEKDSVPAPVMMATLKDLSFSKALKTPVNSSLAGGCKALRNSGRLMVTFNIQPCFSTVQYL